MAELFNSKYFNEEVFGKYMSVVPNVKLNKLRESRAITSDKRIADAFVNKTQTGSVYATLPYYGLIGGTPENYDGSTNIVPSSTDTYKQGVFTYGRAKAWTEADFSYDVTAGTDFMANVRSQVTRYWNDVTQDVLLAILEGIFKMDNTGSGNVLAANAEFVSKHTYDITNKTDKEVGATTLNTAIQQACGDNKQKFSMLFCHSVVSTHLENLNLLQYLKYTDENGIQRDLGLGSWNGRLVVVDDSMPTTTVVTTPSVSTIKVGTTATAGDKFTVCGTEIEWVSGTATGNQIKLPTSDTAAKEATAIQTFLSGITTGEIANFTWTVDGDTVTGTQKLTAPGATFSASVSATASTFAATITANATESVERTQYTTYVLGEGAIGFEQVGAMVPYEMVRDALTNGGQTSLVSRQRNAISVAGVSYTKAVQSTNSPTNTELKNGLNWSLVCNSNGAINHKAVPLARIISLG